MTTTSRSQRLLAHVRRDALGMEIGASYNPVAPRSAGFDVHVVDCQGRAGLVEKYAGHDVDTGKIEEVDFVWRGEPYAELTGRKKAYDWIIASHVIEHTPDLIGFLASCDEVLKDDGVLSLAVPDKRYCFDYYRPVSSLSQVVEAHEEGRTGPSAGAYADYVLNGVLRGDAMTWGPRDTGEERFSFSPDLAVARIAKGEVAKGLEDVHIWCFVPHAFRLLVHDLNLLGLLALCEVDFAPSVGCEFFMTLGRSGKGSGLSRLELCRAMDAELAEGARGKPRWRRLLGLA